MYPVLYRQGSVIMIYNENKAIIENLNSRRFFKFKNKKYIIFDKETGLLWSNHPSFSQAKFSFGAACDRIKSFDFGFPGFEVPQIKEIEEIFYGGNPLAFSKKTILNAGTVCMELGDIINNICKRYTSGECYPCSRYFVDKYDKDSVESILELFIENELIPVFDYDSTDIAYAELLNTPPPSKSLKLKFLGTLQFDSSKILSQYDITAINSSLYKYCDDVKKLCKDLIYEIDMFERNNTETLFELKSMTLYLSEKYIEDTRLSDEENEIFLRIYCRIRNSCYIDLDSNKELLKSVIFESDKLKERLDNVTTNNSFFEELGKLEAEVRPSFSLLVDVLVKRINSVYESIISFSLKQDIIDCLLAEYKKMLNEHIERSTSKRSEYIDKCKKEYIDSNIAQKWIEESKEIAILRLKVFSMIVNECLEYDVTSDDNELYDKIFALLSLHAEAVNSFYENQRIGIYQNNAFSSYSEALDRIETEKKLYEATSEFRKKTIDLITDASEGNSRIIIICTKKLCDMPIMQLLDVKSSDFDNRISQETFAMLDKLRYDNYDNMKKDARFFAEEQERRDKEFNSLLFRMKKELERG